VSGKRKEEGSMDRARFRFRLEAEERRLEEGIAALGRRGLDRSLGESLGESAVCDNHPADIATETFEREKDFGRREDLMATLGLVRDALARVEGEAYGICRRCGQVIPSERLEAVPWTGFCVRCEEAVEEERASLLERPPEEDVSPNFSLFEETGRGDAEAWEAVARYGTSSSVAGNPPGEFDESSSGNEESLGLVDRMDAIPDSDHDPAVETSSEPEDLRRPGRNGHRSARRSRG
jgi:RNA polymerase-binding transcription factor DksA